MKNILLRSGLVISAIMLLTGCATTKGTVDPYHGQSPTAIYKTGMTYLKKGNYTVAITAFQSLDAQYPFNEYTKKGDLGLIYANFKQDDPAMALATSDRFIKMYPTDPNAAYAYYMTGVIDFNNGRGFLQRRFPYAMGEHDISNYISAYRNFSILVQQYPKSKYTLDAKRRMVFLDQVMAKHQLYAGEFYLKLDAYVAAANRASNVLLNYPHTPEVESALLIMLQSYHALGLSKLVHHTIQVIQLNYPKNKTYQKLVKKWNLKI